MNRLLITPKTADKNKEKQNYIINKKEREEKKTILSFDHIKR